jgi:hypothetical protein
MTDHTEEIAELEQRVRRLKEEQRAFNNLSKAQKIADALHGKLCRQNHTDGCGWGYESWDKPGHAKKRYLDAAEKVLRQVDYPRAVKIVEALDRLA